MQTFTGAIRIAAKKAGVSLETYLAFVASGLKKCTKCKLWKRATEFNKDQSRHDGLKASCRQCSNTSRPISFREHKAAREKGFAWCVDCQMFRAADEIKNSRCPTHRRQYEQSLYLGSPEFRYKRRAKTSFRRRNVDAVPPEGEAILLEDFGGVCAYCPNPATTYDHIIPVSQGGRTTPDNIVPACRSCNASKGTKDIHEWMAKKGIPYSEPLLNRLILAEVWTY